MFIPIETTYRLKLKLQGRISMESINNVSNAVRINTCFTVVDEQQTSLIRVEGRHFGACIYSSATESINDDLQT